ncbi:phage tail protein [Pseudomonas sp. AFG_SD02_1510_Pfu_092]|uniref:phage tail protein n=1 Tax=Pseudomonas sp. AFG_SD02_1510_Pfu_092 TaxID=2259497 RepID=UPI000DEEA878|nr:tail fiber protein [Pseudomonas sp. AFG_SD02_1510_Pfu_092]RCL21030.1 phage tail protein [Pseudomonas sp. AFG_SD02_1510_Pfu_092]
MSDPFLGEIRMFAGNFAPRGWALCQGQLLSIAQNSALFAILGTTYGGNGQSTFGLPDLRGRSAVGVGTGPGLPNVNQGELAGANQVSLLTQNLPPIPVAIPASKASVAIPAVVTNANLGEPTSTSVLATPFDTTGSGAAVSIYSDAAASTTLKPFDASIAATTVVAGGSAVPVSVQSPYLGMNFIIALEGIFPSRD